MIVLETWLESPLATAAGWALFHSLWEGAIIAIVLAATLAIVRSPRARYTAACLAMCAILVSFAVTLFWFVPRHPGQALVRNPIPLRWNDPVDVAATPQAPLRRIADLLPWLVPFWIIGVALFYLRHLASWTLTRRLRRTGVCSAPDFWQERLNSLARRLRLSPPVALLESCLTGVPVVIGYLRPVILVPVGLLTGLPANQIESILLHELAHIRRYDYLVNMLQTSIEGLLFYHPVVWWISGVIRTEREHCCDDLAVALSGDAHQYALALATLEQCRWDAPETALAATGGNIVKRIRRLLVPMEGPSSALTPFVSAGILIITAAVGLTAPTSSRPRSAPRSRTLKRMRNTKSSLSSSGCAAIPLPALPKTNLRKSTTGASRKPIFVFPPRRARPVGRPTGGASILSSAHPTRSTIILPRALTTVLRTATHLTALTRSPMSIGPIDLSKVSATMC